MSDSPQITIPPFCEKCLSKLVHGAGYADSDPWRALSIAANIAMFQGATAQSSTHERIGNDITRIGELGCLGCYAPDLFQELIIVAKQKEFGKIKALGESWIHSARGN